MHISQGSTLVTAIIVLGSGVDQETGLCVDDTSASRIRTGVHELLRARQKGAGVIILAPGKPPAGEVWRSSQTFASILATEVCQQMSDIGDDEHIVNDSDDSVWTTWKEVGWAVDAIKIWYRDHYMHQMVSWNDYTNLKLVFVSDRNHVAVRIPLMVKLKLGYWQNPPGDDRFLPEKGMQHVFWLTGPRWTTATADHKPTPIWYEAAAIGKFLYNFLRGK